MLCGLEAAQRGGQVFGVPRPEPVPSPVQRQESLGGKGRSHAAQTPHRALAPEPLDFSAQSRLTSNLKTAEILPTGTVKGGGKRLYIFLALTFLGCRGLSTSLEPNTILTLTY